MVNLGDTGPLYGSCQEENAKCQQLHKNTECWNTERSGMSRRYIIEYNRDMQRSSRKDLQIMGITKTHAKEESTTTGMIKETTKQKLIKFPSVKYKVRILSLGQA